MTTRDIFQHRHRRKARVFPASGGQQIRKWLKFSDCRHDVNPVPNLRSSDQGQELVGRQIERMQGEPRDHIGLQGEKAVGTVGSPLDFHPVPVLRNLSLDEILQFAQRPDRTAKRFKRHSVGLPAFEHGRLGIMENVDVTRSPGRSKLVIQRQTAGDITLRIGDSVLCQQTKKLSLERG